MDKDLIPEVSIIMPVYNGSKYVAKAIESILGQTFTNFEFLIIDNASEDNTLEIISSFKDPRIKLIKNPRNLHLIKSLNIGLEISRGKYVARMDHDDISLPRRLEVEHNFLEQHPTVAIVGTWSIIIDGNDTPIKIHKNPTGSNVIKYELLFGNTTTHPSIMMRKDIIIEAKGYDEKWLNTEDYNLYSRVIQSHEIANIPEPLLYYRTHGSSLTGAASSQSIIRENTFRMMKENIQRYFSMTEREYHLVTRVLINRIPDPSISIHDILETLKLYKKIHRAFLDKEGSRLSSEDRRLINQRYRGRRDLMFKKYLIAHYHRLTGKS